MDARWGPSSVLSRTRGTLCIRSRGFTGFTGTPVPYWVLSGRMPLELS